MKVREKENELLLLRLSKIGTGVGEALIKIHLRLTFSLLNLFIVFEIISYQHEA